jgi:hypothetical protein
MSTHLSDEAWAEVERLYRSGASAKVLAKRYRIASGTIHSRSCKEKWRETCVRAAALTQAERIERAVNKLETILQRMSEAST